MTFTSNPMAPTDLELSYEEALHGVQSALAYKIENGLTKSAEPKHLRVGIDSSKSDHAALVALLLRKGILNIDEYLEQLRLQINEELHQHEEEVRRATGHRGVSFR